MKIARIQTLEYRLQIHVSMIDPTSAMTTSQSTRKKAAALISSLRFDCCGPMASVPYRTRERADPMVVDELE
jgi:hypothetical protein